MNGLRAALVGVVASVVVAGGAVVGIDATSEARDARAATRAAAALAALPAPDGAISCLPADGQARFLVCWSGPAPAPHVAASLVQQLSKHQFSNVSASCRRHRVVGVLCSVTAQRDDRDFAFNVGPEQKGNRSQTLVSGGYNEAIFDVPGTPVDVRL